MSGVAAPIRNPHVARLIAEDRARLQRRQTLFSPTSAPAPPPQPDDPIVPKRIVLTAPQISRLRVCILGTRHQDESGEVMCPICMEEDLKVGDYVLELPCKHWYHKDCIDQWMASYDTCPTCRRTI